MILEVVKILLVFGVISFTYGFLGFLWACCEWWLLVRNRLYVYQEAMLKFKLNEKEALAKGLPPSGQEEFCRAYFLEKDMEYADEFPPNIDNYKTQIILACVYWPFFLVYRVFKATGYPIFALFLKTLQKRADKMFSKGKSDGI